MDSKQLAKYLELVKIAVPNKSSLPILTHVHLNNNGQATWTATDLSFGLQIVMESLGEDCDTCLPADKLQKLVKANGGDITITSVDHNRITLDTGSGEVKIATMDGEDYPSFADLAGQYAQTVKASELIEQFGKVLDFVSSDESRFNLNTVFVDGKRGQLVATDGHRLGTVKADWISEDITALIPGKGIKQLVRILGKVKKEVKAVEVSFDLDMKNVIFVTDLFTATIRLEAGDFPDYVKVIPSEKGRPVTFKTDEFMRALRQVRVMTSDKNKGIDISFAGISEVHLNVEHPDLGTGHVWFDTVDHEYWLHDGFLVNIDFLLTAVKEVNEETFNLYPPQTDGAPFYVEDSIIMPMRR